MNLAGRRQFYRVPPYLTLVRGFTPGPRVTSFGRFLAGRVMTVSPPKRFELGRRELGVPHRVLNCLVAEIVLDRARIVAGIGQGKAATMAQHVCVNAEAE